jgi:hypothetical protein
MEGSMGTTESVQLAGINDRHLSAGLVARSRDLRGLSGNFWTWDWSGNTFGRICLCLREDVSRIRRPRRLLEGAPAVRDPR